MTHYDPKEPLLPKKAKPKQSEDSLQASCIVWFQAQYPKLWEQKRLFSIPNGANKSVAQRVLFKRTGLQKGVADLFLSIPRNGYGGLFIELKVGNGSLSEEQETFIKAHETDYCCQVVWTLDEFITAINNYLKQ
jgi:hypothetical protein